MTPGVWVEGMGEISGFGGGYEQACQQMLRQGLQWFTDHPDAKPEFKGFKNVFGLITEENHDAKSLSDAICAGVEPSGAMHQAVIGHLFAIRRMGWEAYVAEMSKPHGH
jgi:hypothetical protein